MSDSTASAELRVTSLLSDHRTAVFAHVLRLTDCDSGWAEDVVQETFLRAWRHWETMTPEHGSVRGWLLRVAHNLVIDEYRLARRRRGEVPLRPDDDAVVPEVTEQVLFAHWVRDALAQLPDIHREALEATYLSDRTVVQAASALGVPVGTVKSRVFYGLRMLRGLMVTNAA